MIKVMVQYFLLEILKCVDNLDATTSVLRDIREVFRKAGLSFIDLNWLWEQK